MTGEPELPELPMLSPWYRLVEEGERLVFEHAGRVVVLEGAAVRRLLPPLLPLLDGTRTRAEIVEVLGGAVAPAVDHALALLAERGLLAAGPPVSAPAEVGEAVDHLAAGGIAPAAILARLAAARVGVVGAGPAAVEVARVLRRSGVGAIERRGWRDVPERDELVVAAPASEEVDRLGDWNAAALAAGAEWLQVLPFDGRFVAVGPLFLPGDTACHECYRLRRAAGWGLGMLGDAVERAPTAARAAPAVTAAAAAVAAAHALRWLALRDPRLPGVLFAVEVGGGVTVTEHLVLRVPRCPACSRAVGLASPQPWFEPPVEEAA